MGYGSVTYQVAHNNLALTMIASGLSGSLLGGSIARLSGRLLDTSDGRRGGGSAGRVSWVSATGTDSATLG